MIELEVSNFQSIRHATMAVSGFAAIVGRSNIGKSAIVRAAGIALTGAVGTDFVRHGQECDRKVRGNKKCKCFSKVVIRTQAMELIWEKGDSVNRYTFQRDGSTPEVWNNLDRGTPEFLKEWFLPVKVGDRRELIQIPDQFEPVFLLNKTGTVVADVLSDVARLDSINRAMADVTKDRKDASSKRKVREEDAAGLRKSLSYYDGLDAIDVASLTRVRKELEQRAAQLTQVNGFLKRLESLKLSLEGLEKALQPEMPDKDSLETQGRKLLQVHGLLSSLTEKVPALRALMALDQATTLPNDALMVETYTKAATLDAFTKRQQVLEAAQVELAPVEQVLLPEEVDLKPFFGKLEKTHRWLNRLAAVQSDLNRVPVIPDLPEIEDLRGELQTFSRYDRLWGDARSLADVIRATAAQVQQAGEEEAKALAELQAIGMCPTCDQPVGANHRLHLEAV